MTGPAVPVAPAAADAAHIVTGPVPSAVERATADARARIAASGSAIAPVAPAAPAAPAAPVAPVAPAAPAAPAKVLPPRTEDGTFAPQLPAEVAAEAERKRVEAANVAAGKNPDGTPKTGREGTGDATALTEEQQATADAEAAERRVTVKLGEDEIDVEFAEPEVAERMREIAAVASQAEAIEGQAKKAIEEMLAVRESFQVDPVGFMYGEIKDNPAAQDHLILSLLTDPEVFKRLGPVIAKLSDPTEFRTVAAEQKAARGEYKQQAEERIVETRAVQKNLGDIQRALSAILPAEMTPDQQRVLYADMLRDVKQYADRYDLLTINIDDIPVVLGRRLQANGIDPVAAAKLVADAVTRAPRRGAVPARRAAATASAAAGTTNGNGTARVPAAKTGSSFVASAERRKAVAAIPAAGAGSPTTVTDLTPPLNPDGSKMTGEQTIAWHRDRVKKGIKSY